MTFREATSAALLGTLTAALALQVFPAKRTDPPVSAALVSPPEVDAALRRACYDCHSNETRWPWYSHVAPFSWLIAADVERGRREVNFSEWGSYYSATRRRKLQWIARSFREAKMPPWSYRLMHPDARLSDTERALLERWIASQLSGNPIRPPDK